MLRACFADGEDDPDLVLLKADINQAEYWDAPCSRMVVAFDYLNARLRKTWRAVHTVTHIATNSLWRLTESS